ncbi:response regulator [Vibrio sinensis]|uniref:histidine kinase n=1 Tax=Vibrio sinensis TaxID=2302434 RepID=A0A3A6QL17_9VIBR|nr:ATP-binding protein [Vibrio sinensis]RJX71018.1 response regulator [Vibrio sinensis]
MSKITFITIVSLISSICLFAYSYQSFQNSRSIDTYYSDISFLGHDLIEHRDIILNYQQNSNRKHFILTKEIVDIEKLAAKYLLELEARPELLFTINTYDQEKRILSDFYTMLLRATEKMDILVGIQVARKYAQITFISLLNQRTDTQHINGNDAWYFFDLLTEESSQEWLIDSNAKQFASQLRELEEQRTSIISDLLEPHSFEFVEQTERELLQLSNQEAYNSWLFMLAGIVILLLLASYHGYQRYLSLKRLNRKLEQTTEKAQRAAKAKSRFLATMSHELRTPMNGVLGIAQIISTESQEAKTLNNINIILDSGQHLMTILNDILDFSKVEENKLKLECTSFQIDQILTPVKSAIFPLTEEKNLDFDVINSIPPQTEFQGDSARLRQIVYNLAGNAVKFTKKGKVTIHTSLTDDQPAKLKLVVSDTGIGIPKEKHNKIFHPFEQADTSTTRQFGGSGLGLAIVKKLTDLMQGDLYLESERDKGTTFTLTFSLPYASSHQAVIATQTEQSTKSLPSLTILLAEDNRVNAIVAKSFCNKLGHHVDLAENGLVATKMVQEKKYDLILMDNHMPKMNGIEATYYIRQTLKLPILIFAYTADVFREAHDDFINAGANHVLTKPLQKESFNDAMRTFSNRLIASSITCVQTGNVYDEESNIVSLHRQPISRLHLTEEELSNSRLLLSLQSYPEQYFSIITSVINEFEQYIERLISAFADTDKGKLKHVIHNVKQSALTLDLTNIYKLSKKIEIELHRNSTLPTEDFQKIINRLSVNIHQGNRVLDTRKEREEVKTSNSRASNPRA